MIGKLLRLVLDREPVASAAGIGGVVIAVLGVVAALGVDLEPELVAAIGTLVTVIAGWLARKRAWSPVSHEEGLARVRTATYNPPDPQTPTGEAGFSIVGVLVGIIVFFAAVFLIADACWDNEDDPDDLGWAPAVERSDDDCGDRSDGCGNENGRDCYQSRGECSDDDQVIFAPTICTVPHSCHVEEG